VVNRLCSVSVDLDAIRHYRAIHGLEERAGGADPVLTLGVARLAEWAKALSIPLTWFVVGRDLDDQAFAERLVELVGRRHELANHSLDHFYDLTCRGAAVMRAQVLAASERLSKLTGNAMHGFRAPGYTMTDELRDVLGELSVPYDSSVFPCPLYHGAKAFALSGQKLFGRKSRAILDSPRVLEAPLRPYRMGPSYSQKGNGLLEFPIQVTPRLRIPFIGTALTLLGATGACMLAQRVTGEPLVNLELHGIDALDRSDNLDELARVQYDLRIPWQRKLRSLAAVVQVLRTAGYEFVTLEAAARALSPFC